MKYLKYMTFLFLAIATVTCVGCEDDDTDFSDIINKAVVSDDTTAGNDESTSGNEGSSQEGTEGDSDEETSTTITTGTAAVSVVYKGSSADVSVTEDVAAYLTVSVKGADVSILQSSNLSDEVTYVLSGSSADGMFYMDGELKATVVLNGLTLTNSDGPAIAIDNGKRIAVVLADGTTNTLKDGSSGSQKGCFMVNGHTEFEGGGTLNLTGNLKHAFWGDEYVQFKKSTGAINVLGAVKDGFNVNQHVEVNGGTIIIKSVGDDGIQVGLEGDGSEEDTGAVEIHDGTLNISAVAKGIKAEGAVTISGGTIDVNTIGRNGEGIESKSTMDITGGVITVNSYDDGLNSGGDMTISGGSIYVHATNNDGIDANGNCYIKGGLIFAVGASQPEVAIDANTEGGKRLYVSGGTIVAIGGLESGSSLTQSCYAASAWSKNTWYALTFGDTTFAFKTPSSGGNTLVVSVASTPSLKSGITVSGGTSVFGGLGFTGATVSGGSSVSLSSYSGGNGMGGGPGGGGPGGRGW